MTSSPFPGLPTTYQNGRTYTLAWNGSGGELTSATVGDATTSFSYFYGGLRKSKTSGGVTKNYYYDGSRLIAEKWSTGAYLLYHYDENGSIYAITYSSTGGGYAKYYLLKNIQGDVVQIRNSTNGITANYEYDAWGNVISVTYDNGNAITSTSSFALINPIRYRGYYYDSETGFYYLQSRYYDPANCRFVSADNRISLKRGTKDLNLFAYCGNDPVNMVDPTGEDFWDFLKEVGEGFVKAGAFVLGIAGAIGTIGAAVAFTGITGGVGGAVAIPAAAVAVTECLALTGIVTAGAGATAVVVGKAGESVVEFSKGNASSSNNYQKARSNKQANDWAQAVGEKSAESLKESYVGKGNISKYNILRNKDTGQLVLERITTGALIFTEYYLGN